MEEGEGEGPMRTDADREMEGVRGHEAMRASFGTGGGTGTCRLLYLFADNKTIIIYEYFQIFSLIFSLVVLVVYLIFSYIKIIIHGCGRPWVGRMRTDADKGVKGQNWPIYCGRPQCTTP
jgi:hypothetical protein